MPKRRTSPKRSSKKFALIDRFSEVRQIRNYQLRKGMLVVSTILSGLANPAAFARVITEATESSGCGVGPTTISRIESNLSSLPIGILR
jgi:hypothetical protein